MDNKKYCVKFTQIGKEPKYAKKRLFRNMFKTVGLTKNKKKATKLTLMEAVSLMGLANTNLTFTGVKAEIDEREGK